MRTFGKIYFFVRDVARFGFLAAVLIAMDEVNSSGGDR